MELITDCFSKAIYSTWLFSKPLRTLFDAGEGLVSALRNRSFAIEKVFISHGHFDHIGGLPGLIRIRGQARGDKQKPLTIYYPEGDTGCELIMVYLARLIPAPSYPLEWVPLKEGMRVPISEKGKGKFVEPFPVDHIPQRRALGYSVVETRERLKSEYASLEGQEIAGIVREKGRESVSETYEKKILCYGGDGMAVAAQYIADAELLVHEATFLDDGERGREVHSTVSEAVRAAADAGVSELLLFHFSTRYGTSEIFKALQEAVTAAELDIPVHVLLGSRTSALKKDLDGD